MRKEISKQEVLKFYHSAVLFSDYDSEDYAREIKVIEHLIDKYCEDDELLVQQPIELYDNHIFICQLGEFHLNYYKFEIEELEEFYNNILSEQKGLFLNNHRMEIYKIREIFKNIKENPILEELNYDYKKPEYQKTHTAYNLYF
jgi:hypothetical protein